MTPRQARVAFGCFLMLTVGVAINALFLQAAPTGSVKVATERGGSRPAVDRAHRNEVAQAGRAGTRVAPAPSPAPERPVRTARLRLDLAHVQATPELPQDETEPETIRAVHRELKQRGYGPLSGDGVMRPATRAAIMAYEHDQGLPLTGEASETLLKRILLGAPEMSDTTGAGKVRSPHAEQVIRLVQGSLAAQGYRPGPVDGRFSAETVHAIRVFEMDHGLVPTGRISGELVSRLTGGAAGAKSTSGR